MNKMSSSRTQLTADLCVIGAGMVGLAHAFEARRRGLSVVLLEREQAAVGASVRNFGHLFAGSQPDGRYLEMALVARERWLELAGLAGLEPVQAGTLVLARAEDELAVLEAGSLNPLRGARILTAAEALALDAGSACQPTSCGGSARGVARRGSRCAGDLGRERP
jgi:glycine/D-amino acid oxidase-like deaminating enzyme